MDELHSRFDRSQRLFGAEGQRQLRKTNAVIIGVGGLGTHVAQQSAILGVGALGMVDPQELDPSNKNRYVGVWHDDPAPGSLKAELAERHVHQIDPSIETQPRISSLLSEAAVKLILQADYVFGCVDNDGLRFVLNEICLAYEKPLFDIASDVPEDGVYGGRVFFVSREGGCLYCNDLLDMDEVRRFLSPHEAVENENAIYGIVDDVLGEMGPSVGPINGVVVNLAMVEFMADVTELRAANRHLDYRGDRGTTRSRTIKNDAECYYCNVVRGSREQANIERYYDSSRLS